jgi:hypothetical protein
MKIKALLSFATTAVLLSSPSVQAAGSNTFSGRAFAVEATVNGIKTTVADTGELPSTGGTLENNLDLLDLTLPVSLPLTISTIEADLLHTKTTGSGSAASSLAEVANLSLPIAGLVNLSASVLNSNSSAVCKNGRATVSGSSVITDLDIDGVPVTITGAPNQVVLNKGLSSLLSVKAVVNEQIKTQTGTNKASIKVNALHVTVKGLLGVVAADVVVASSKSDITCVRSYPAPY